MRRVLHIVTRPEDALSLRLMELEREEGRSRITRVDLTTPEPDYEALLERVFEADSIQVW
jgi:hypothetical protein